MVPAPTRFSVVGGDAGVVIERLRDRVGALGGVVTEASAADVAGPCAADVVLWVDRGGSDDEARVQRWVRSGPLGTAAVLVSLTEVTVCGHSVWVRGWDGWWSLIGTADSLAVVVAVARERAMARELSHAGVPAYAGGVFLLSTEGLVVAANSAVVDWLGLSPRGDPIRETGEWSPEPVEPDGEEGTEPRTDFWTSFQRSRRAAPWVLVRHASDGRARWFSFRTHEIAKGAGRLGGLTAVVVDDVSEWGERLAENQALLTRRTVALKDVHHRVKNHMQVISSLLSLQAMEVEDPRLHRYFENAQNSVRALALVHERLHRGEGGTDVDLDEYVKALVAVAFRGTAVARAVQTRVRVDRVALDLDTTVPLGLIINELLTEILESLDQGRAVGIVRVSLWVRPEGVNVLEIHDDGHESGRRSASRSGGLVDVLAKQIRGKVEVDCSSGTLVRVSFPSTV